MRKRRVLALLLALSLVVSGNGMTVLAAEQGADMPVSISQENTEETVPEEKEDASGAEENTSGEDATGVEDKSEGTNTPAEGDSSNEEENAGEEETPGNPETPETPANPGEGDPSAPKEDDAEQGESQPSTEDGEQNEDQSSTEDGADGEQEEAPGKDAQDPAADAQLPSVSENDVDGTEVPEEELVEKAGEVRMMSFTDASGLQITFDANAAEANAEKVTIVDGVLTAVDSSVEGVIDLRKESFTAIGEGAFQGKNKVTYVMLPKTVISVGKDGFASCTSLKGISIPSKLGTIGDGAFQGCTMLTQLAIPNTVTTIGANAFKDDSRLFMLNMLSENYSKLETIGDSAFEGCSALEFFCSDDDYNLPDSLKSIGASAFKGCVSIDEVDMEDGITTLGMSAYQGCTGIKEVEISAGLETVPENAFADCSNLIELSFSTSGGSLLAINALAFENCRSLASVEFPQKVSTIRTDAFKGCTALRRVYIRNDYAKLEGFAFPNDPNMCIVGSKNSTAQQYAKDNGDLRFIPIDEAGRADYYTYTSNLSGPTGNIALSVTREASASATDINKITNKDGGNGVKAGTECFVMINWGTYINTIRLVPGSLRCNGEEIAYDKTRRVYSFEMPYGGAAITAEFEYIDNENRIDGNAGSIEGRLSSDVNYDYERNIAYMQEGKTAKFYLINNLGGSVTRIPTSKVTYRIAVGSPKGVVSVDAKGEVKALKEGTAIVEAEVNTKNSGKVVKDVTIVVKATTGIDHINVQLDENEYKTLTVEKDEDGLISGVSLATTDVSAKEYDFDIEANAFAVEDDEEMKVPFTWVSSDTKVAKVEKASTPAGSSENEITVPRGADGEATITVSATGSDNRKVTKKFVVSVQNYAPRLTETKITVNPKQQDGATTIGIIDAYGHEVDNKNNRVEAYENKENGSKVGGFIFDWVKKDGVVSTYRVVAQGKAQGTYNVKLRIYVQVGTVFRPYDTPLTIVVKESQPKPTVSFDKKAEKINLFYANDGVEIQPVISKLGDDVVSEFSLEPLTESGHDNYEDDKKFTENFQIDSKTGTITQKAANLLKNKAGKPVLTGYLVLKFEGYGDLKKKYKITIPTKTTAPAYVLERTTDTFGSSFAAKQTVDLGLLDKKTKKPIAWDEGFLNGLTIDNSKTTFLFAEAELVPVEQEVDGKIQKCAVVRVKVPANPDRSGKLVMKVHNSKWAEGKEFTYTYNIKIDTKPQKLSLKKATVTFNANYPERVETFTVVSNHRDVVITGKQTFEPQSSERNASEYQKLVVVCEDGEGSVSLKSGGQNIKAGSYKYVYKYTNTEGKENKVTLTVKVNKAAPTVTLKGTNAFNLKAKDGEKYVETSEMTLTVKNLPSSLKYLPGTEPSDKPDEGEGDTTGGGDQGSGDTGTGDGNEGGGDQGTGGGNEGGGDQGTGGGNEGGGDQGTGGGNEGGGDQGTGGGNQGSGTGTGDENQGGVTNNSQMQALAMISALAQTENAKVKATNPEFYSLDAEKTFKSIVFTTKGYESRNPQEYFDFEWVEDRDTASGKIRVSLAKQIETKTYTLKMYPVYKNGETGGKQNEIKMTKAVSFKIKVYNSEISTVKLTKKGKMNLLDRRPVTVSPEEFEYTEKNGIRYTPTISNLKDTLKDVKLLAEYPSQSDFEDETKYSTLFEARITEDKKSFYVMPKQGAELDNNKTYRVYAWLLMDGYKFKAETGYGIYTSTPLEIKTTQVLPKVKTNKTSANLFMASKAYEATFVVQVADEKSIGSIERVAFGERDEKANDSFEVWGETQEDGSLKVHLKLKSGVTYGCNTTNKIKMYIQFTGQGTNTAGTPITMNVKINK